MNRLIIAAAVAALSACLLIFAYWCFFPIVTVKVINKTNHNVINVVIAFGDARRIVQELIPGEEKSWNITNDHGEGKAVLTFGAAKRIIRDSNTYLMGGLTRGSLIFIIHSDKFVEAINQTWF